MRCAAGCAAWTSPTGDPATGEPLPSCACGAPAEQLVTNTQDRCVAIPSEPWNTQRCRKPDDGTDKARLPSGAQRFHTLTQCRRPGSKRCLSSVHRCGPLLHSCVHHFADIIVGSDDSNSPDRRWPPLASCIVGSSQILLELLHVRRWVRRHMLRRQRPQLASALSSSCEQLAAYEHQPVTSRAHQDILDGRAAQGPILCRVDAFGQTAPCGSAGQARS